MECAVCYNDNARCTLRCSHVFCHGCVKTWYEKGTGEGCPMCRAPIYFKGFIKRREEWVEVAYSGRQDEIVSEAIGDALEHYEGLLESEEVPKFIKRHIRKDLLCELVDLERTGRFLKSERLDNEELEYLVLEDDCYFSDRHLGAKNQGREPPRRLPAARLQKQRLPRLQAKLSSRGR